jgi:hypothetical protein
VSLPQTRGLLPARALLSMIGVGEVDGAGEATGGKQMKCNTWTMRAVVTLITTCAALSGCGSSPAGAASGGSVNGTTPAEDAGGDTGAGGYADIHLCPDVGYSSYAHILADLPVTPDAAAALVFTACREAECYSAKGNSNVWTSSGDADSLQLIFTASPDGPTVALDWPFLLDTDEAVQSYATKTEEYRLQIQLPDQATPTTIFDTHVRYRLKVADPTLVGEGFGPQCSLIATATVDLRTAGTN